MLSISSLALPRSPIANKESINNIVSKIDLTYKFIKKKKNHETNNDQNYSLLILSYPLFLWNRHVK